MKAEQNLSVYLHTALNLQHSTPAAPASVIDLGPSMRRSGGRLSGQVVGVRDAGTDGVIKSKLR